MTSAEKKKILIVDDNDVFLNALKTTLTSDGYAVTACSEAQGALHLLGLETFDVVLSDVQMPGLSGVDFLKKVRETSKVNFVLMTGFSEIQETTDAVALGANGFLAKPFKKEELLQLLTSILPAQAPKKPDASATPQANESDYISLPIENFISGSSIRFSIYVRLSNSHFVKIAHQGEDLNVGKIAHLKSKGLKHLYLLKTDYRDYVGFMTHLNRMASQNKNLDLEKKNKIIRAAGEVLMSSFFKTDLNREIVETSQEYVKATLSVITDEPKALTLLEAMQNHGDFLFAHSISVSTIAVAMAHALNWASPTTLMKLSMAALYHDIGKKEIPLETLQKPRLQMTAEEVAIFETHPQRASDLLSQIPGITDEITLAAMQHHETAVGTGYPRKLTLNKIIPFARLIAVADEFVKLVIKNPDYPTPMEPKKAFSKMLSLHSNELDPQFFKALEICLQPQTPAKKTFS